MAMEINKIVGVISSEENRVVWEIPEFFSIRDAKRPVAYSPEFTMAKRSWKLFVRVNISIDIGVYQVTKKVSDFKVRLGIATKEGVEFSTFGMLSCGGRSTFTGISLSEIENKKEFWLDKGNINLFFAIEDFRSAEQEKTSQTNCTMVTDVDIRKLHNDLEFLMQGSFSDVVVKVRDKEFKCHRCILGARSPVFLAMMTHDTKENSTGVIDIEDADPGIFPDFLHYLYTGSVMNMTPENALDLYSISDKYQVTELKNNCLRYAKENIAMENFCDIIALALQHTEQELIEAGVTFFKNAWNSLEIIKTSKWQVLMKENPVACNELFIKLLESKKS